MGLSYTLLSELKKHVEQKRQMQHAAWLNLKDNPTRSVTPFYFSYKAPNINSTNLNLSQMQMFNNPAITLVNGFSQWLKMVMITLIVMLTSAISFSQTTFSTSGTYTVPPGVTAITVNAWGAGGGGGGGYNNCAAQGEGSGGGGGGYAGSTFAVVPGQTYIISIGAAGTGGAYNGNGGAGGTTTVTGPQSVVMATGGGAGTGGGLCGTAAGGSAGTGASGTILFSGGNGSAGIHTGTNASGVSGKGGGGAGSASNGVTPNTVCPGTTGAGGTGTFAGGNGGVTASCGIGTDAAGQPGTVRGGGGSGGQGYTGTTGVGGAGGAGQVVIQELTPATSCIAADAAPTSLSLTAPLSTRINISYTAAAGADGYLIVRYPTGSSPTAPSDGTLYSAGSALGSGTVLGYGGIAFVALGVSPGTTYDIYVYSANTLCTGGPLYFGTALTGTVSTPAAPAATTLGGLWSSPATWITGAVPAGLEDVTIPAGSTVTIDQVVTAPNLTINGTLQWNGAANAITVTGNLTIGATGRLLAYTTALANVGVNVGGNYTNNGYANHAATLAAGFALNFNGTAGSTLSGTGTFEGNGANGIIRSLAFQNTGSNVISTSQNLIIPSCTGNTNGLGLTAGSLNTNGKLKIDNTAQVYGRPINLQVASLAVTTMGSLYNTAAPIVFGASVIQYVSGASAVLNSRYVSGSNVYLCTLAGTFNATAPTSTGPTAFTTSGPTLLFIGTIGQLGLPYQITALTLGTQYAYNGNLYTCTGAGVPGAAGNPPTHLSGTAASGTAVFLYAGTAATATVNWDATTQTVRSLNLTNPGNGYTAAPAIAFSVGVAGGTGSGAVATAVWFQQIVGVVNSVFQKSGSASITGAIAINSDQGASIATLNGQASSGVGAISTTSGGINYSVAPQIAFAGPTALNLITNAGSGYTAAPTITVSGGTLIAGSAYTSASFVITVNQGLVESVYLTASTAVYSVPPTLAMSAPGAGTTALLAFPAGCWPAATPTIGSNGQITSFTVTNAGFGYVTAPLCAFGPTTATAEGGTFTTAAATPTARIALYNLILSNYTPSASVGVAADDAAIPSNRKLNVLNVGSGGFGGGLTLTGGNLTVFGTTPLVLSASAAGNILNLGGANLNCTWNAYAGATATFGTTSAYIKNGSMSLTGKGGSTTFSYPFSGQFNWFSGSTPTAITTGSTVTRVTVTETGAPSGTGALGTRAFQVNNNGGIQGLNPTVAMTYNTVDALPTAANATDLYIGQSTALTGAWTPRSASSGSGTVGAAGSRTTATVAPGPLVPTGNDFFAWTTVTLNFANVTVAASTCSATAHLVSADITSSLGTITGATITYNNGAAGGPSAMTNVTGSTWQFTIPAASPTNTNVTWSITATNSFGLTKTFVGTTYQDDAANGVVGTAAVSVNPVCSGNPTSLTATFALPSGANVTIGTATTLTTATTQPTAFCNRWPSYRMQILYTAAELQAAGLRAGNITSMAFNTTTLGDAATNSGFIVKIGSSLLTAMTTFETTTTYTTVFPSATFTHTASGLQTIPFSTPYVWNGTSNIIVEMIHNGANLTNNSITYYTATPGNTVAYTGTSSADAASLSTQRLNVVFVGAGITTLSPVTWNDGVSNVGTGNPFIVSPTVSTTYTATGLTVAGCPVTTSGITVTTNPLPTAPAPNNSSQCGTTTPGVFVTTGGGGGGYRWYLTPIGGTAISGQIGAGLTAYPISAPTHFYVAEIGANGCESPRTDVFADVVSPDPIGASSNGPVCSASSLTLTATVTSGTTNNYTYVWTASPAIGSGIPTTQAGGTGTAGSPASITVTPTAPGTYTYTVTGTDGGCITTSSVIVTIKALPVINTPTATPATICAGGTVALAATTNLIAPTTQQIGAGTVSQANNTTVGAFYGTWYGNGHAQLLIKASELSALGFVAGNLSSLSINVSATAVAPDNVVNNFTIKLGSISAATTAITTFQSPTLTTVYGPTNYTPVVGLNTHNFIAPYAWDGTSNIIVDYCFTNGITGNGSAVNTITTTSFGSFVNNQVDGAVPGECTVTTVSNASANRPNIRFSGLGQTIGAGSINWSWNPGALSGNAVSVTPAITTTYTVTALDPSSTCSNTATVLVTVNPLPAAPSANNGTDQCGTGLTDASVSSNNINDPQSPPFFKWYTVPTGGIAVQSGTSPTFLTAISVTTTWYVSEVGTIGCEGPRVPVTTIVSDPDPITVSVTGNDVSLCLGESTSITASYTPSFNAFATFELTATGGAASGVTGTVSLTPNATGSDAHSITPTAAGTYTYTITALDPDKGCTSVGFIVVTVNALPAGLTASASATTVCAGVAVNLTSGVTLPAPVFNEGFATVVPVPSGWAEQNLSSPPGTITTWSQGIAAPSLFDAHSAPATSYARASFNNISGAGIISNWLFTPATTLKNGDVLTFWTRTVDAPEFADRLQVRMSTNGASVNAGTTNVSVGDFTTLLLDINPTLAPAGYPNVWTQYTITLSGLGSPVTGRLAFRYFVNDGGTGANSDNVGLDDVSFVSSTPTTYAWTSTPAGFTSNLQSPANVTVNATTTYHVTATNGAGCSSTANVLVTALALPNAPSATGSTQCGIRVPEASVSSNGGGGNGTFNWYANLSGGIALQSGTSTTYTTAISSTTTFYVSESGTNGCESGRTAVTVTVTTPPSISTAGSTATVCLNGTVTLHAGSDDINYVYTWTANPGAGSGITGSLPGSAPGISNNTITPTVAGTYTYTVTGSENVNGCSATATVVTTVNPNPATPVPTATPATICNGGTSQLNAGTFVSGTLTTPTLGGNGNAGNVFDITATNTITVTSVSMGITAGSFAEVWYKPTSYGCTTSLTSNAGWTLLTPSGGSAITAAGAAPALTNIPLTTIITIPAGQTYGFVVVCNGSNYYTDGTSLCTTWASDANMTIGQGLGGSATLGGGAWSFTNSPRNFNGRIGYSFGDPTLNYVWTPAGTLSDATAINPVASPTSTQTYTVTTSNSFGCSSQPATVTVSVTPVGATATATPSGPVCSGSAVTLNAGPTGGSPYTIAWASTPAGSYPATASISVNPTVTTSYTVTVTDNCGNPTTSTVTVNVNPLPTAAIAEAGPITLCFPSTQVLTAVTNVATASYQWTLNGVNIPAATGATYTINTASTGTYRVIVTNTVTNCVSAASAGVVVTINAQPAAVTITPATATICNGGSQSLVASGGTTGGAANAVIGTGTTLTSLTAQPTAFCNRWPSSRMQTLFTAAELSTAGLSAGSTINSMAFTITSNGDGTTNPGFTVKIAPSALTVLSGDFVSTASGFTTVYPAATYTHAVGVNVIPFSTSFTWNGTSNLIVEVLQNGADAINNSETYYTTTATDMVAYTTTAASNAASFSTQRLNVSFGYSSLQTPTWSWSPAGSLNTATGATVIASPSATTTYTATATNSFGCTNSSTATVTVNPRPTGTISGTGVFCQNAPNTSTNLTLTFSGTAPWSYTYTDGTTPVSGTASSSPHTIVVSPSSAAAGLITYTLTALSDAVCASIAADLTGSGTVTINPLAATPTATVTQPTCGTATGTITVTAPLGTGNSYTLDGTTTISWPAIAFSAVAPGVHTITVSNSFGCSAPASASVTVDAQPITPAAPTVTGTVNVCPYLGTAEQITYTATAAGATTYTWTLPPNVNLISGGTGTDHVTVTFNTGFSTQPNKQIRVTAGSTCGTSAMTIYYLLTQFPVTPNPISGPTNVCTLIGTSTAATYTITPSVGAVTYVWTAPAGATVTHPNAPGVNDLTINVTFDNSFAGGPISVTAVNGCGTSGTRTLNIINSPASVPGLISGPTNVCGNIAPTGTAATYAVTAVASANSYTWTAPAGAIVTHPNGSGVNDYTITVLYPAGFTSGTITVTATNGCGTSAARSLTVTKLNPATPGNIDVIQTHVCGEAGGRVFTYSVSAIPANATSVQWTIPATGATLVSGQGTASITVAYLDVAITGTVTAQAVNNCGASTTRTATVRLPACPPPSFTGVTSAANSSGQTKNTTATANSQLLEVKIFPNPTVSDFKLEVLTSAKAQIHVRILDGTGRLYKTFTVQPYEVIALGAELKTGAYLVEVRQGETVKTTKVIKF